MDILKGILEAREKRAGMRNNFAQKGFMSVSLSLNIPGYPKSNTLTHSLFTEIIDELKTFLAANRITINESQEIITCDEDGDFYLVSLSPDNISAGEVKNICEIFEEEHTVGRLLDIDLCDEHGAPVSSGKAKPCYYCGKYAAVICMREKRHSLEQLRGVAFSGITEYLEQKQVNKLSNKLATHAIKAILSEISLTPKPGLVDMVDSGIHKDMDYSTFLNSTSAISPFFIELAKKGFSYSVDNYSMILPQVRTTGLLMEKEMFSSTGGVNTQKGIIFLMGLSVFISAYTIKKQGHLNSTYFKKVLMEACAELDQEVDQNKPATHGSICVNKYGYKLGGGARAEAQSGFPKVFNHGLPELQKYNTLDFNNATSTNIALKNTLVAIIAESNDSNVLYRSNPETLRELKKLASKYLSESSTEKKETIYNQLIKFCKENNISPGGSADLLAVTVFIYLTGKDGIKFTALKDLV